MPEIIWTLGRVVVGWRRGGCGFLKWVLPFVSSQSVMESLSSSPSPSPPRSRSEGGQEACSQRRAMTRKNSGWSSRGWQTLSRWHQSLVSDGGRCPQDQWKQPTSPWKVERSFQVCLRSGVAAVGQEWCLG